MSDVDISKGSRSMHELFKVLEEAKYGVICLTPENQNEPWINFEAGALGKVQGAKVCTYLLGGLKATDITGPLKEFQASPADENETKKLLQSLNSSADPAVSLSSDILENTFNKFWPDIRRELDSMPGPESPSHKVQRKDRELLEEMLELLRKEVHTQRESRNSLKLIRHRLDGLIVPEVSARALSSFGFGRVPPTTPPITPPHIPQRLFPEISVSSPDGADVFEIQQRSDGYYYKMFWETENWKLGVPPGFALEGIDAIFRDNRPK